MSDGDIFLAKVPISETIKLGENFEPDPLTCELRRSGKV